MTVALSPRLASVGALVPSHGAVVADIGAGHGGLCARLAERSGVRIIATEISAGPLTELRANLAAWSLTERVEVRCGAGLAPLAQAEADVAVIAGVGARTMLGIAGAAPAHGVRWLVLQCMQGDDLVQPWLERRGWSVVATEVSRHRERAYTARLVEVGA